MWIINIVLEDFEKINNQANKYPVVFVPMALWSTSKHDKTHARRQKEILDTRTGQ